MVTFNNKNFSLPNKNLTHEILSPQKFLRIQYVYFTCIRKVRIETILGLPCTNLGSKLCATILRLSIQSPTHYFLCGTCTLIGRRHIVVFEQRTKLPFPSTKAVGANFYHGSRFASNLCTEMHYLLITFSMNKRPGVKIFCKN